MSKGKFPRILKETFIYKSGERTAAANYRPIALARHLSKVMERVERKFYNVPAHTQQLTGRERAV